MTNSGVSLSIRGFLKQTPYFRGLTDAELEEVTGLFFERALIKGELVFLEGERSGPLCFVVSGRVKIFKISPEGKEQILRLVLPGEAFNEVPVFDNGPNPASAEAMEPTVLLGISGEGMRRVLKQYPRVAEQVVRLLAARLRHLVSLVEDFSFRNVVARVAKLLLEQAQNQQPHLTQQEMAAMVGTAREMVSRSLRELEDRGLIKLERHRIIIQDARRLGQMVEVS